MLKYGRLDLHTDQNTGRAFPAHFTSHPKSKYSHPPMRMTSWLRSRLSKLILRGWILEIWLLRKMRLLECRYLQTLLQHSARTKAPETMPAPKIRAPLQRMLFISDIHW